MIKMKKLCLISLVIALVIVLVGGLILTSCGPEVTPPDAIKIGAARSLSGPLELIGDYAFGPVLDYWVDEVNAAGGINVAGKDLPVVLDIKDDTSDMGTMVNLLSDMIASGDYDFVFAPVSTAFFQAAAAICNMNDYILMGAEGGCTSIMDMLDELPYVFGVLNFADHNQMEELFKLFDTWGVETVAEIHSDNLDGLEYSSIAASEAAKYPNIDIVMSETVGPFPENVEILLQQAEALNADVFCAFAYPATTYSVVGQAIANNITFNAMVLSWGANFQYFYDTFGAATEGVIGLGAWNEDTSTAAAAFAADMIAMHGREYMDWWGQLYYYAGLQCFQQAIERAGTLDQSVIRDILATEHFTTVLGDTWFEDANGNHPIAEGGGLLAVECHPGEIGQWQSGIFEVIAPTEKATAGNLTPPIELDVTVGGETVGKLGIEVGTDRNGNEYVRGSFNVTKKKSDGTTTNITELEEFLCQDHLNWFQKVLRDTNPPQDAQGNNLTVPYIDPPNRGYNDQWGDDIPWYWDEYERPDGESRDWSRGYLLEDNRAGATLEYEDSPTDIPGTTIDFETFLISDCGDGRYVVLGKFYWTAEVKADNLTDITQLEAGGLFIHEQEIKKEFGDEYKWVLDCCPSDSTNCFIATAAYGTPMAEEIEVLREFRDEYLLTNPVGEALVDFYYQISPPIAEFITEHPALKPVVRAGLVPAIAMSTVAVNTTLAEKIAIASSVVLVSTLLVIRSRKRASKVRSAN